MSRFHDRISAGEPAIGSLVFTTGAEAVEAMAHVGFDFLCIDQMVTAIDWTETAHLVRAAKLYDCSPWIRLQGYPWAGASESRSRIAADVMRAMAIGAEGITASVDSPEEASALLHPLAHLHRTNWIEDEFGPEPATSAPDPIVFPLVESLGAAERIQEFFEIEGLETLFLGLGDLTRLLGASSREDPRVLSFVQDSVRYAQRSGKYISVTTGRASSPQEATRLTKMFWEMGVKAILLPYPTYVLQAFYHQVLVDLESIRPRTH